MLHVSHLVVRYFWRRELGRCPLLDSCWLGGRELQGRTLEVKMVRSDSHRIFFHHSSCNFSVMAAMSVANIVKTSLGPVGLDKMLVDDVGVRPL